MSTRSYIGIKDEKENEIKYIYCHFDGYIDGVGRILVENYTTKEIVEELISHGDLSVLGEVVGTKHDFMSRTINECTFYHRDRGEELKIYKDSMIEFNKVVRTVNYGYVFMDGDWYMTRGGVYSKVKDILKNKEMENANS